MDNAFTARLTRNFFTELSKRNIQYCILRGYDDLPSISGRDIDVFIENKKEITTEMLMIFKELSWNTYVKCSLDGFFTIVVYRVDESEVSVAQFDFWTSLNYRGIRWCSAKEVLSDLRIENGFFVPSHGAEAAITALKELFGKGNIKERYYNRINAMATNDQKKFAACLSPLGQMTDTILSHCINREFGAIDKMEKKIKRYLIRNHILYYLKESANRFRKRSTSFFAPKGLLIAFIGPDGSGKTTVIEKEEEYLSPFFSAVEKYHIRYNIFPELKTGHGVSSMKGKIAGSTDSVKGKKCKATKRSMLSIFASWLVVLYYTLEFVCGNHIVRKHRRRNKVVLFDRYYYDHFIQPTTRDLIYGFRRFLFSLVKKPDLIIHLNADPEVVYARKKELLPAEIATQNEYIIRLLKNCTFFHSVVTSSKNANVISAEIFQITTRYFKETRI